MALLVEAVPCSYLHIPACTTVCRISGAEGGWGCIDGAQRPAANEHTHDGEAGMGKAKDLLRSLLVVACESLCSSGRTDNVSQLAAGEPPGRTRQLPAVPCSAPSGVEGTLRPGCGLQVEAGLVVGAAAGKMQDAVRSQTETGSHAFPGPASSKGASLRGRRSSLGRARAAQVIPLCSEAFMVWQYAVAPFFSCLYRNGTEGSMAAGSMGAWLRLMGRTQGREGDQRRLRTTEGRTRVASSGDWEPVYCDLLALAQKTRSARN